MRSEPRGFALVAGLLAILCIGSIVTGMAFVARQDFLLGSALRRSQQAFTSAELAAWSAAAALDSTAVDAVRGAAVAAAVSGAVADSVRAYTVRLSETVYAAVGEAASGSPGSGFVWKRTGVLLYRSRDSSGTIRFAPLPGRSWFGLP